MSNFEKVKKFMQKFGQDVKTKPSFPNDKIINLRYNLIKEELSELDTAIKERDILEIADALTDILYVIFMTASIKKKSSYKINFCMFTSQNSRNRYNV